MVKCFLRVANSIRVSLILVVNECTVQTSGGSLFCYLGTYLFLKFQKADEPSTGFSQNEMETITTWQMTAFSLRSITAVLRRENKPLFGALNARQV